MDFANVTDISIPEGNVIKIHETNSGRVLWEKKSTPTINYIVVQASHKLGTTQRVFTYELK